MHLALTPRRQLRQSYGPAYAAVSAALDEALAARIAAGVATLAYDPEDGLPELGVGPSLLTPAALATQLAAIERALASRNGIIIESLWIVGGPDTVPFGIAPNPMRDRDGPILTDSVYGMATAQDLLVHWPVGRTPDAGPAEQRALAHLLSLTAAAHRAGRRPHGPALGISTARWATVSAEVFAAAGEPAEDLLLAPPLREGMIDRQRLAGARRIYCNLHGVIGSAAWYGQSPDDSELIPALRPADLAGVQLDGSVVITQACFGARLSTTHGEQSLAMALLAAGAVLIGAIGLSYGAPDPPASESDLLALQLLIALRQPGRRLGEAVTEAHTAVLRDLLRRQGGLDDDDTKTLLEFVLYGDPALPVS
ncbi:hypothetical protein K2Z83_00545 [Oscillochloris sp. ZM17-4]|uniref:C25 family cysteine peptidase n=1 Tax=Oscillochloris sp. ZM17-4 TaxID=2866714 RepID=UPI001C72CFC9|nr:C25 family cysteine peptidase [Oscillochloris sp. ZM17-4]MBX0326182.1 hypothetical protein [Oscillochloris sp. ZM17-4]